MPNSACTICKTNEPGHGTTVLNFNAIAGERFTRQIGNYGVCSGNAFKNIVGIIDWGDGTPDTDPDAQIDYRDYLGADNGKCYGSHTYLVARPGPYQLCPRVD